MSTANSANSIASILVDEYEATLNDGSAMVSEWIDCATVDKFQFTGDASTSGLTATLESKSTSSGAVTSSSITYNDDTLYQISLAPRQRYMRFTWTNNTGSQVTDASLQVKLTYGSSDRMTVAPLNTTLSDTTQSGVTQSILKGKDSDGDYESIGSESGALKVSLANAPISSGILNTLKDILIELRLNNKYLEEITDNKYTSKDLK